MNYRVRSAFLVHKDQAITEARTKKLNTTKPITHVDVNAKKMLLEWIHENKEGYLKIKAGS